MTYDCMNFPKMTDLKWWFVWYLESGGFQRPSSWVCQILCNFPFLNTIFMWILYAYMYSTDIISSSIDVSSNCQCSTKSVSTKDASFHSLTASSQISRIVDTCLEHNNIHENEKKWFYDWPQVILISRAIRQQVNLWKLDMGKFSWALSPSLSFHVAFLSSFIGTNRTLLHLRTNSFEFLKALIDTSRIKHCRLRLCVRR